MSSFARDRAKCIPIASNDYLAREQGNLGIDSDFVPQKRLVFFSKDARTLFYLH